MRITRIYQPIPLSENLMITLDKDASHHILHVLRLQTGTQLKIFNGQGGEYDAELIGMEKKHARIKVKNFSDIKCESPLLIHLGQGIVRGEKMDLIIQKAIELGVNEITPLITEFSNVKLAADRLEKKHAHWQAVAISACEQSGRNKLPKIHPPELIATWLQHSAADLKIILDPFAKTDLKNYKQAETVCIVVGPEGGFCENELDLAKQHHFLPLQLGPRILRTETAALAAIAILQAKWGDMSG